MGKLGQGKGVKKMTKDDLKKLVLFVYKVGWDTGVNGLKMDREQKLKLLEDFKKKQKLK